MCKIVQVLLIEWEFKEIQAHFVIVLSWMQSSCWAIKSIVEKGVVEFLGGGGKWK
jgi:hypothetical protein